MFSGTGVGNSGFGDGPVGDWALESSQAIQFARDTANPVTGDAYVTVIA